VGTWHDPDLGRPIAAPLDRFVEPYVRVNGTKVWSLMQLERQLRPQAFGRVRGGFIARRREHPQIRTTDVRDG
jgi:hypothetical protein